MYKRQAATAGFLLRARIFFFTLVLRNMDDLWEEKKEKTPNKQTKKAINGKKSVIKGSLLLPIFSSSPAVKCVFFKVS